MLFGSTRLERRKSAEGPSGRAMSSRASAYDQRLEETEACGARCHLQKQGRKRSLVSYIIDCSEISTWNKGQFIKSIVTLCWGSAHEAQSSLKWIPCMALKERSAVPK